MNFYKENMNNSIDAILYLNLDHRKDRRNKIEQRLLSYGFDMKLCHRIVPEYDPINGHRGCVKAHLRALDIAIDNGYTNYLLFEDDFTFSRSKKDTQDCFEKFLSDNIEWDVFMIGANIQKYNYDKNWVKIESASCGHGYMVNSSYFFQLRKIFLLSQQMLSADYFVKDTDKNFSAFDQVWKLFQRSDRWYAPHKLLGIQEEGMSDIGQRFIKRVHKLDFTPSLQSK